MFLSLAMALGAMEKILYRVCPEAALGVIKKVSDGEGEASAGVVLVGCRLSYLNAEPHTQAPGPRAPPISGLLQCWPEQRFL